MSRREYDNLRAQIAAATKRVEAAERERDERKAGELYHMDRRIALEEKLADTEARAEKMKELLQFYAPSVAKIIDAELGFPHSAAPANPATKKEHCPRRLMGEHQGPHLPCDAGDFSKDASPATAKDRVTHRRGWWDKADARAAKLEAGLRTWCEQLRVPVEGFTKGNYYGSGPDSWIAREIEHRFLTAPASPAAATEIEEAITDAYAAGFSDARELAAVVAQYYTIGAQYIAEDIRALTPADKERL